MLVLVVDKIVKIDHPACRYYDRVVDREIVLESHTEKDDNYVVDMIVGIDHIVVRDMNVENNQNKIVFDVIDDIDEIDVIVWMEGMIHRNVSFSIYYRIWMNHYMIL